MAVFAAWADTIRNRYPWSSHLHYVNPLEDEPPTHCTYGEHGWADHGTGNVLEALVNYTSQVASAKGADRDIAMRYLTHYMGDLHQPLHLTGRARGGNDIAVHFEGRYARLHTVWDSQLLNAQIRALANYTSPLPSARIESALLGRNYDAYIRWILAEGLGQARGAHGDPKQAWWHDEADGWTVCPEVRAKENPRGAGAHWLRTITPRSAYMAQRIYATIFSKARPATVSPSNPADVDQNDLPLCPFAWSKPMHPLVCKYAFASPVPEPGNEHRGPLAELDTPAYAGRVAADHVLQKQLAKAGIRLAAVLNSLLLPESDGHIDDVLRVSATKQEEEPHKRKHPKHGGHHKDPSARSPILGLILTTTESIAEVIILSSVGYLLARQGVLDKTTQTKINKVNVSFFTPALLFSKVAFTLDPARLAELIIVPAGFVIITVVSALVAWMLSSVARLTRAQRNFSIACAITPNSNSLPVALMQSLVATVPQLHWEEEGEPEDNVNGMLGRALTYLVLFSTLGMFLRWSLGAKLLSSIDESKDEPVIGMPVDVPTGQLIDHQEADGEGQNRRPQPTGELANGDRGRQQGPPLNVRRSTEDGGGLERVASPGARGRQGPPAWARSFPNSPGGSESGEDEGLSHARQELEAQNQQRQLSSILQRTSSSVMTPLRAVASFMTMPLYSALISLIVAMIPPLQKLVGSIKPLVGALETAGACSIPLTMVVLGAYFYRESEVTSTASASESTSNTAASAGSPVGPGSSSGDDTLVERGTDIDRRKQLPSGFKPGRHSSTIGPHQRAETLATGSGGGGRDQERTLSTEADQLASHKRSLERRTVAVAVGSRMILTPLILLPCVAWYAIATRCECQAD